MANEEKNAQAAEQGTQAVQEPAAADVPPTGVKTETADGHKAATAAEPTYTQEQVDALIRRKTGKYLKRVNDLETELEARGAPDVNEQRFMHFMKKLTGAGDSESDMVKHVKNFYGVTDEQAASYLSDFKVAAGAPTDSEAMNILKAQRFVKRADAEEIADEYERLSQKAPSKRTKADQAMLDKLAPAYRQIAMRREYNQSKKWYEAETGKAFDDLMKDTDFNDFARDLNVPLTAAVKKYVKLKGVQKEEQPVEKKNPPSSGSVKSAGESVAKDFYTREEVEAMTDAEKRENYETIKKSIPKWKV